MAKAKRDGKKPTKKIKKKQSRITSSKKARSPNRLIGLAETDNTTLNTLYIIDGSDNDITLDYTPG